MTSNPTITQDYVADARRLAPRIRGFAARIDQERRLPIELVDEMRAAGFFHLVLPRDLGGREADAVTAARAVEEVSRADGSAGWCLMIAAQNAAFAGFLDPNEARAIWKDDAIVCGVARPIGRAVVTEGGYRVSGRWPFASGSSHAEWFASECMVYEGEAPRRDAQGNEVSRMCFVPRAEVNIHDTWYTLGLRGTASNDFSVENALVPAGRGFQVLVDPPRHPWALYRALPLLFINHGAQSLGVARAAIDSAIATASEKKGWGNRPLTELPRIQAAIAEATALVESAGRYLYGTAGELWDLAVAGNDDAGLRARVRLATSHAAKASLQAVDLLHGILATSSIFTKSPLERYFRDIHTASAHVMVGPMTYEASGRVLLGRDPEFPFF